MIINYDTIWYIHINSGAFSATSGMKTTRSVIVDDDDDDDDDDEWSQKTR